MSRFLLLSEDGSGLGLALRLQAEGHSVKMWHRDPRFKDVGKGLIDCACDYEFGQIVIPECIGFGPLLDIYRDCGVRTFAGSGFADSLEEDRELAEEVMHSCEIETPLSKRVTSWEEAKNVVEKLSKKHSEGKVVIKPEGKLSGIVPSYVASSPEDAVAMLESFKQQAGSNEPEIVIQEFIEGIAVSTEGWFNGEDWVEGLFNHTLENKKTLNDDLGPSEGCAGNVVWSCDSSDPLMKQLLLKLTERLREARYVGPIDVNAVVNEEGIYALEFTPRFGYDAFPTLLYTLCDFGFGSFVDSCVSGNFCRDSLVEGFGAGVRLTLPADEDHEGSTQIRGLSEEELQWFYPYHLHFNERDGVVESIHHGNLIGVLNGHGDTVGEAFARAYLLATKAQVKDVQFRSDLSEVCLKDFRKLSNILSEEEDESWIGVDLDGTLAEYSTWSEDIGKPIPRMIRRIERIIADGKEVRILTARVSGTEKYEQAVKVYEWVKKYIGAPLEVTDKKDPQMVRLYDDRVKQVVPNTGELVVDRFEIADSMLTKEETRYENQATGTDLCEDCFYFDKPDACRVVKGKISPQGWCQEFEVKLRNAVGV